MATYMGVQPSKEKPYFFISYNTEDAGRVSPFVQALCQTGVAVWYDYGIPYDAKWKTEIAARIDQSEGVILFYTNGILLKKESFVVTEYEIARQYKKKVLIILLDDIYQSKISYDKVEWIINLQKYHMIHAHSMERTNCIDEILRAVTENEDYSAEAAKIGGIQMVAHEEEQATVVSVGYEVAGKITLYEKMSSENFGDVYKARNKITGKEWIVRAIETKGSAFAADQKRIETYLRIQQKIAHPRIMTFVDLIKEHGYYFLLTEVINGESVISYLRNSQVDENIVLKWAYELCEIIGFLHMQKPSILLINASPHNFMIGNDNCIYVSMMDCACEENMAPNLGYLGTSFYFSPDLCGGKVDRRTDIYSLGALFYYLSSQPSNLMMSGGSVKQKGGLFDAFTAARSYQKSFSQEWYSIIKKCCEVNPMNRYQSINEVMLEIDELRKERALREETEKSSARNIHTKGLLKEWFNRNFVGKK